MRSLSVRFAATAAAVFLASGCYTYQVVDSPPVGSMVRVRVPVSSALSDPNRAIETASIEGLVIRNESDTLSLATETTRQLGAYRELTQFDTLRLASTQMSSVELREFSKQKSVILGVAIAGGATLLAAKAFGLGGGESGQIPGPGDPVNSFVISRSVVSAIWGAIIR
jgi:hypothetical protein